MAHAVPQPVVEPIEIRGDLLSLVTTVEADRAEINRIRATPEVWLRWRGDDLDAKFDENLADAETHQLTIRDRQETIVGMVQFWEEDDPEYRHAGIDIFIDPSAHRSGLGAGTLRTLISWLIDERGYHRVTIDPAADNDAAIACYASVGFRSVGLLRQYERQPDGTWADGLLMDLLAADFLRA